MTLLLQSVAVLNRAAVLPDNGVGQRLSGLSIPQDGGFALIGDGDCRNRLLGARIG